MTWNQNVIKSSKYLNDVSLRDRDNPEFSSFVSVVYVQMELAVVVNWTLQTKSHRVINTHCSCSCSVY